MDDENKNGAGSDNAGADDEKNKDGKEDEGDEGKDGDENFDYEKELDRVSKKGGAKHTPLEKAQYAAKKIAEEISKLGGDPRKVFSATDDDEDDDDDDKKGGFKIENVEQLQDIIAKAVRQEVGQVKSTFAKAEVESRIQKLAKSPKEAELIEHHFNNTIVQTGDLSEDLENAYIIANKHRTKQIFEALADKKKAADGKSDGVGSGQKRQEKTRPKVSPQEEVFAKSKGLVWSDEEGRYVSPSRQKHNDSKKK